jgi:hypothetical protein
MAARISLGPESPVAEPAVLFKLGSPEIADPEVETYRPSPDGQRFLSLQPVEQDRTTFSVIVNWQQLMKAPPPSR